MCQPRSEISALSLIFYVITFLAGIKLLAVYHTLSTKDCNSRNSTTGSGFQVFHGFWPY